MDFLRRCLIFNNCTLLTVYHQLYFYLFFGKNFTSSYLLQASKFFRGCAFHQESSTAIHSLWELVLTRVKKKWKEELIDTEMYYSYPKDDIRLQRKKSYMQHHADSVSIYASLRRKNPSLHLEKTVLILKYFQTWY